MNHHESSNFRIPQPVAATVAPTAATNPLWGVHSLQPTAQGSSVCPVEASGTALPWERDAQLRCTIVLLQSAAKWLSKHWITIWWLFSLKKVAFLCTSPFKKMANSHLLSPKGNYRRENSEYLSLFTSSNAPMIGAYLEVQFQFSLDTQPSL